MQPPCFLPSDLLPFSVTGAPASGGAIADTSTAAQVLLSRNELNVTAGATFVDSDSVTGPSAGDRIDYAILLANTGTATLRNISVSHTILDALVNR